jgi:hypothetical protein
MKAMTSKLNDNPTADSPIMMPAWANAGSNPQVLITNAPVMMNGIVGGWATANGAGIQREWLVYRSGADPLTGAMGLGTLGYNLNSSTPFGVYSTDILAAVGTSNVSITAGTLLTASRSANTLRIGTSAANAGMELGINGADRVLTLLTGGLMFNAAGTLSGGMLTAGSATMLAGGSSLYVYSNGAAASQITSQIVDNGYGPVSLVKGGTAQLTLGANATARITGTTANSTTVSVASTTGLAVGMHVPSANQLNPAWYIQSILSATQFLVSTAPNPGSNANNFGSFGLPVVQVLPGQTLTAGGSQITLPAGAFVLPGMTVTLGANSTGSLGSTGTLTVVDVTGGVATLSGTVVTSGAGRLMFQPATAVSGLAVPGTLDSTNLYVSALGVGGTVGLVVGRTVSGTGIPADAYVTAIS